MAVNYNAWQNSLRNAKIVEEVGHLLNQLEIPEEGDKGVVGAEGWNNFEARR